MDERALARVIEVLETDPDFYTLVKELWEMLREEELALDLDLETFQAQLASDERFEFMDGLDPTAGVEGGPRVAAEVPQRMQAMDLFGGPRVKLRDREMTAEDVFAGLTRSLRQLNEALRGAWESCPAGDAEAVGMLRDALTMAEQLEREVQGMVEEREDRPGDEVDG
jgi:hypothetical protein